MCTRPLHGFVVGKKSNGKDEVVIMPHDVSVIRRRGADWVPFAADSIPEWLDVSDFRSFPIDIPCNHCVECRLHFSRSWATRMMLEQQYHEQSWFITLTYDDKHIPLSYYPDPDTGEAMPVQTLEKKALQDFMKRLRDHYSRLTGGDKLRYYAVGEYGDSSHRPHYHLVVFGLNLSEKDLTHLKNSALGFPYYASKLVESCWTFGYSMVCAVTWESCAYVARYCMKKLSGDFKDFYQAFNIQPEFSLMSRKPGIARLYYEDHKSDIYKYDEIFLSTTSGGMKSKPPRYFDQLFDIDDPELLAEVKARRIRYALASERQRDRTTTLTKDERLQARADLITKKARALVRPDI